MQTYGTQTTNIRAFVPLWNLALSQHMRSGDSSALSFFPGCVAFSCLRTKYRANESKETTGIFGKVGASCWPDDTSPLSVSSILRNSHRCCTGEPSLDSVASSQCPCQDGQSSGVLAWAYTKAAPTPCIGGQGVAMPRDVPPPFWPRPQWMEHGYEPVYALEETW